MKQKFKKKAQSLRKIIKLINGDTQLVNHFITIMKKYGIRYALKKVQQKMHTEFVAKSEFHPPIHDMDPGTNNSLIILTPKHTLYVAHLLKKNLSDTGFDITILSSQPATYSNRIHIVIAPQIYDRLPSRYIAFQMEQSVHPRWFTERYFTILKNSIAVFDYSLKNIDYLQKNSFSYKQLFYMPISYFSHYPHFLQTNGYWDGTVVSEPGDVVFYGDPNNERRQTYLRALQKRFKVKVISEVFGNELYHELLSAKIIVNIHYYEDALLETTRIYECLSLGLYVVSEESTDMEEHDSLRNHVHFTPIGDIDAMIVEIEKLLETDKAPAPLPYSVPERFSFYLKRALISIDMIPFSSLQPNDHDFFPVPATMYCLGLPENIERRASFNQDNRYGFEVFDGLRHTLGWIGCGLSYKHLVSLARQNGLEYVIICEDDVSFPDNFETQLETILEYLDSLNGEWDVFAGFIADIHPHANISKIENFKGTEFIHMDKMTSMVFNIYHHSFYDKLLLWNENDRNVHTNTVDRYIESMGELKVITMLPYFVGHKEDQTSSIWHFHNSQYNDLVSTSEKKLQDKIIDFKQRSNTAVAL